MNVQSDAIKEIENRAQAIYFDLKNNDDKEVIVFYVGDLNMGYANAISSKLEQLIENAIQDKQARKKFYTVYIEAIQNIRIHGLKDENGGVPGAVTVYADGERLYGTFMNFIDKKAGDKLLNRYEEINNMSRDELKSIYLEQMTHGELSSKGGAGLGILIIVLRSQNPSVAHVFPGKDDYNIFETTLCVDYKI